MGVDLGARRAKEALSAPNLTNINSDGIVRCEGFKAAAHGAWGGWDVWSNVGAGEALGMGGNVGLQHKPRLTGANMGIPISQHELTPPSWPPSDADPSEDLHLEHIPTDKRAGEFMYVLRDVLSPFWESSSQRQPAAVAPCCPPRPQSRGLRACPRCAQPRRRHTRPRWCRRGSPGRPQHRAPGSPRPARAQWLRSSNTPRSGYRLTGASTRARSIKRPAAA